MNKPSDPFRDKRREDKVLPCDFQGEEVPMILGHADLRAAAKDWRTFSSDAPYRVPIPSEESLRRMRQLPIETDPPEHKEFRKIVEPFFKRSKFPEVIARIQDLIAELVDDALQRESIEIVRGLALPLQSRALTYLLDVPESEAETWIDWGIHVFKDGEGEVKGATLENYLEVKLKEAAENPGKDFFSALTQARYQGRNLTPDEMMGFANLTFAGGRDTIIHTVSSIFAYLAKCPEALAFLKEDPKRIVHAGEELFRVISPLTHIGRVCPVNTDVHGFHVKPKGRVSLCWVSANNDEAVFEQPAKIQLDRKPNPHVAFGFGPHICLGAPHARLIVRALLETLCDKVHSIDILEAEEHIEMEDEYNRSNGYEKLLVAVS